MANTAIQIENLSKRYRLGGQQANYQTLRESLMSAVTLKRSKHQHSNEIWALRDVSLTIQQGDVLGIIGRNGAGKSTLLKIISRITRPTSGQVRLRGRVGSLLEVGTGFHPELTGRENIYLNGAILGMHKAEIGRKFNEIVAFAEIEQFLDTPVKHYSSGMYMRLAFAVAAHLEPEILLVDEVLAVGDAAFQKKCLGKMGEVSREGRTVLFVSHAMGAIVSLCNRCILIEKGCIAEDGPATQVTESYQANLYSGMHRGANLNTVERTGSGKARFVSVDVSSAGLDNTGQSYQKTGEDLNVNLVIHAQTKISNANVALIVYDSSGYRLIDANTALQASFLSLESGQEAEVSFLLKNLLLKPGFYLIGLWLGVDDFETIDGITYAVSLSIEANPETLAYSRVFPGVYQCQFTHKIILAPLADDLSEHK